MDSYGVGSALIRGENDFTADVVPTDGRPSAKAAAGIGPTLASELADRRRDPGPALDRLGRATTCMPAAAKRSNAASASLV